MDSEKKHVKADLRFDSFEDLGKDFFLKNNSKTPKQGKNSKSPENDKNPLDFLTLENGAIPANDPVKGDSPEFSSKYDFLSSNSALIPPRFQAIANRFSRSFTGLSSRNLISGSTATSLFL